MESLKPNNTVQAFSCRFSNVKWSGRKLFKWTIQSSIVLSRRWRTTRDQFKIFSRWFCNWMHVYTLVAFWGMRLESAFFFFWVLKLWDLHMCNTAVKMGWWDGNNNTGWSALLINKFVFLFRGFRGLLWDSNVTIAFSLGERVKEFYLSFWLFFFSLFLKARQNLAQHWWQHLCFSDAHSWEELSRMINGNKFYSFYTPHWCHPQYSI